MFAFALLGESRISKGSGERGSQTVVVRELLSS